MVKSETYRQYAQECVELANNIRSCLLRMAQAWHKLAQEQERADALLAEKEKCIRETRSRISNRVPMRCIACGADMHLAKIIRTNIMRAPGYEHRFFTCLACSAVEQRLGFTPQLSNADPRPRSGALIGQVQVPSRDKLAALRAWGRAMARLRGRHAQW